MKGNRIRLSALLVAGTIACGCGHGGGGSGGAFVQQSQAVGGTPGAPGSGPGSGPSGGSTSSTPPQGIVQSQQAIALPQGYEDPRGVAFSLGTLYVTAREISTQKAVILALKGSQAQVVATGDVAGTPNAMTNPVALAAQGSTLYVADFSSTFSPDATGAVLTVKGGQISVLSAGAIDAPSGIALASDGSLAVCGVSPDDGQGAVFKVMTDGTTTLLAKGGALTQPTGIGVDSNGTLFVSDAGVHLPSAQLISVGASGGTPAVVSAITNACDVESGVVSFAGKLFVSARQASEGRISAVSGSSEEVGYEGGALVAPAGLTTDGSSLYVADEQATGAGQILVLR